MLKSVKYMQKSALFLVLALNSFLVYSQSFELLSPDKSGTIQVEIDGGNAFYTYSKNGTQVINKSLLGVDFIGFNALDFAFVEAKRNAIRSSWKPEWGTQGVYPNNYDALVLQLHSKTNQSRLAFHFRMYDEGLAFKYEVETNSEKVNNIQKEYTEFSLPKQSQTWVLNHPWGKRYQANVPIENVKGARLPLLAKSLSNHYILISEAALYDYGALSVSAIDKSTLSVDIVGKTVQFQNSLSTPWRVVMASQRLAFFVENKFLIQNLNEPSKIQDTAWIKPGISTWDWRARGANENGFVYQLNTDSLKRMVDKTNALGLPYFMIDAGWYGEEHKKESDPLTVIPSIEMAEVLTQAKNKDVGVWLYINRAAFEEHDMDAVLAQYKAWGIVGIKLGFLRKSDQKAIAFLQKLLEKTAQYRLMLNCHECVIPSGIERTWPHFLTREYNHSLQDGSYIASPVDHTISPFLNNVAGPIDVTPGFFDIDKIEERDYVKGALQSTVVAQTAMSLIYFSPFLCLPDIPEAYFRKPELFAFIKSLPLSYDETKVLVDDIGKSYVIARRKSNTWWIAGVVNELGANMKIPLTFLQDGVYKGRLYLDGEDTTWKNNREKYRSDDVTFRAKDMLTINVADGGGFFMMLETAN